MRWVTIAAVGCATEPSDPPVELEPVQEIGACTADPGGLPALSGAREVSLGGRLYGDYAYLLDTVSVFTDGDAYADFVATLGAPDGGVDFATESAVAIVYGATSTCDATLESWAAYDVAGVPHVVAEYEDTSFACDERCDLVLWGALVVAVPKTEAPPTGCLRIGGGCGSPL